MDDAASAQLGRQQMEADLRTQPWPATSNLELLYIAFSLRVKVVAQFIFGSASAYRSRGGPL